MVESEDNAGMTPATIAENEAPDSGRQDCVDTARAPGGRADEAEREAIHKAGPLFIHYLFSASKTVQVHDLANRATQRVLADLMVPLRSLFASEGGLSVRVTPDYLYINDVRLVMDSHNFGPIMYVIETLRERDVETLELHPDVTPSEIGIFLKVFLSELADDDVFGQLTTRISEANISHIKLVQWVERERHLTEHAETDRNIRKESNQVFFRSLILVGEVLRGIEQKRVIQVRKAERLTQQMVDIVRTDESILIGLASIKDFDEYTFAHSVNVCVLSMLIGDRLRLYKNDIARLGVAALVHDIGKMYVPQSILNKPSRLEGAEWDVMKYHPFFGVKELSKVKSPREVTDGMFTALQHHVHYDGTGYPVKASPWDLHLFTRIVTVADYYDAMTTPRIYKKDPLTPDRALRFILEKSGQIFDPFIAKVFIQAIGMYPVGTVVDLDSDERGVVVKQHESSRFIHRPVIAPMRRDGSFDPQGALYDLSERVPGSLAYRRTIVQTIYDVEAERGKMRFFTAE
jgi:HD-GYP domain-containing protein (c-di-GMP phosphodiesterase class II)